MYVSLEELGVSLEELDVSPEELGVSLEETRCFSRGNRVFL